MSADATPTRTAAEARGRSIALVTFIVLATAFIVLSAWNIVTAVFPSRGRAASLEPSAGCATAARLYSVASELAEAPGDEAHAGASALESAERNLRHACDGDDAASDLDVEAATLRAGRLRHAAQRRAAMTALP